MTEFECVSSWLQFFGLLVAIGGLLLIWRYVKYTKTIAEATKRQGDILSRPTISVICGKQETPRQPFSAIRTTIVNHSMVHANIRVTIKAKLRVEGSDHDETFIAPAPYNGTIWPFAAKQEFTGHFSFAELRAKTITNNDTLTLVGTIESSAFGSPDDFTQNPTIFYQWKHVDCNWIPGPSILQRP